MRGRSTRICDFSTIVAGGTPTRGVANYYGGSIPWVKTLDLNCGIVNQTEEQITEDGLRSIRGEIIPRGSVMVAMYGGAGTIGKSGILGIDAATNQAIASVLPNPSRFDPDFLHYQIIYLRSDWMRFSQGNRKDPNINKSVVEGMLVWLPEDVEEQRNVAAQIRVKLTEVENARQATETALGEVDALKAAVYRTTFKQIVPISQGRNLSIAPSGWRWKKLTDIAELESGHTPSRSRPGWWGGDISWVSLTEIRSLDGKWVEETKLRTNKEGIANSSARILPRGTVCFSRTASVGFVTIMAKPMATSQDFANWICGEDLDPEFLMYALLRSRKELRGIAEGATHKTIYMPALHSLHICAPDTKEQRNIVLSLREELKSIEDTCIAVEHQLTELKNLPRSIFAQAFES